MRKLAVLVVIVAASLGGSAWGSNATVFTLTPHTRLTDGTMVMIGWADAPYGEGFREAYILDYKQCTLAWKNKATRATACTEESGTLMEGPAGSVGFQVFTGPIGDGTCGTSSSDSQCLIVVQERDRHKTVVMAPKALRIRFRP